MPPTTSAVREGFAIDRANNTIRFLREFEAPPEKVFRAWTRPEHIACWWDAMGEKLTRCEIDLKPGGEFLFLTAGHPDMPFQGTYREIAPPTRLVFEAMGSIGRVLLSATDGGTRMTVEIQCSSPEQLEQYLKIGIAVGTSRTLDNLVAYLRKTAQAA